MNAAETFKLWALVGPILQPYAPPPAGSLKTVALIGNANFDVSFDMEADTKLPSYLVFSPLSA